MNYCVSCGNLCTWQLTLATQSSKVPHGPTDKLINGSNPRIPVGHFGSVRSIGWLEMRFSFMFTDL
jgi:hypothetical protein